MLHTGSGTSTGSDIYLGQDFAVIATAVQPGAAIDLRDANGGTVAQTTIP